MPKFLKKSNFIWNFIIELDFEKINFNKTNIHSFELPKIPPQKTKKKKVQYQSFCLTTFQNTKILELLFYSNFLNKFSFLFIELCYLYLLTINSTNRQLPLVPFTHKNGSINNIIINYNYSQYVNFLSKWHGTLSQALMFVVMFVIKFLNLFWKSINFVNFYHYHY